MRSSGRLINVSNRLPVVIKKAAGGARVERSSGGLATALESSWRQQPGVWIGWAGTTQNQEVEQLVSKASRRSTYRLQPVSLSEDEIAKFYSGFANEIVWPLFHDMPSRCNFDPDYWEIYQRVNRKFAQAIMETAHEEDFVWVHDYHLMLTAQYLRESGFKGCVGFFLHIPFPAPDIYEKLPWNEPMLRGLLDYDIIGFQTDRDRLNFLSCLEHRVADAKIERSNPHTMVSRQFHNTLVGTFPISIDFDGLSEMASRPEIASRASLLRRDLLENTMVLGVDRLDYTKGIPERLKAFRILLQRFPELRGQITLVQVVVPSREDIPRYKDLRSELELLVSRINGEFTRAGWVPIHYMHRNLGREELLAYYRAADIALITPLKDGMNLVAKEFCAAQTDERGVLVLSEFAGASSELRHGALLVNPNDFAGVAQAIHDACLMPIEEKRTRMRLLRDIVRDHNVQRWARSFMQAASGVKEESRSQGNGGTHAQVAKRAQEDTPGVALVAASLSQYSGTRGLRSADRRVL
jgi:alpha,alpha-trehalose-phosphate synthase [UDP-forming]